MRIIAGKYGGRRLVSFKADHIRPTTDRVKESLFNTLQDRLEGARVLDLFSGTGNLAIEALSRGAREVWAVEKNRASVEIIKRNQALLGIGEELRIVPSEVEKFLKHSQEKFDLILIDPPFTEKMADRVLQVLAKSQVLRANCEVFIESSRQEQVATSYGSLQQQTHKNFGDKFLSHYILS